MKSGTKEWAPNSRNFDVGCSHDCRYCYAKYDAVERFKRVKKGDWKVRKLDEKKFNERPRKLHGRIMFPTTHDITPENVDLAIDWLRRWLAAGNEVLVVSKPHLSVITRLCEALGEYKDKIIFRFTIGSMNDKTLLFWEPGAAGFEERLDALKHAFGCGFRTSVSCEPFLDTDIINLVNTISPWVTDVIWIGKLNRTKPRVDTTGWTETEFAFLNEVERAQNDLAIHYLYKFFQYDKKIRWKESIKKVLGLPEEEVG